jgi:hypothetical protein
MPEYVHEADVASDLRSYQGIVVATAFHCTTPKARRKFLDLSFGVSLRHSGRAGWRTLEKDELLHAPFAEFFRRLPLARYVAFESQANNFVKGFPCAL